MAGPSVDFWYEFASTYSYLSAMRIERLAAERGIAVRWRPFLLGPIFAAQGWTSSPFNLYPAKGRYMWRDVAREADAIGLPFRQPDRFPQNGLLAARVALAGEASGWSPAFSRGVYQAEFADGRDIGDVVVIEAILSDLDLDPAAILAAANAPDTKAALKAQTEHALALGLFGAPSFVARDGELFWGNDRLEAALDWAAGHAGQG